MEDVKSYSVRLLFVALTDGRMEFDPLCEESILVLYARTTDEAMTIAENLGKQKAHSYLNEAGEQIKWEFLGTMELQELSEPLGSGAEVYSRMFFESQCQSEEVKSLLSNWRK